MVFDRGQIGDKIRRRIQVEANFETVSQWLGNYVDTDDVRSNVKEADPLLLGITNT